MLKADSRIFVTGGAGFLGRSLITWAKEARPGWRFTVFSRDEGKHYRLRQRFPEVDFILGDIGDDERLRLAMRGHDAVIHAAALKYVPQCEMNVEHTVGINVAGSINVARAAIDARVNKVVGISTDKACWPVNVYGMTKLMMERVFQEFDGRSNTQFNLVRYGNVVASTGSVIPIFQQQHLDIGKVSVTNPDMTRFWLEANTAVELVDAALEEHMGATILIPRLHSATIKETALAAALSVSDVEPLVEITGHRFGEKLHEHLLAPHEVSHTTMMTRTLADHTIRLMRLNPLIDNPVKDPVKDPQTGLVSPDGYTSEFPDGNFDVRSLSELIMRVPKWG